jgi:Zn-dependent protease
MAADLVPRELLALIPLMQRGGEPGIIQRWCELVGAETDLCRQADHGLFSVRESLMADLPAETPGSVQGAPPVAPAETSAAGPDRFLAVLDEELYHQTRDVLATPEQAASARSAWIWLAVTLGLFVLSVLGSESFRSIALIVFVLFVHEAGHFAGMRLFGYRNVRMFFIPFFGAAVAGRKHAAPVWQQAVVLLLGPLPGLLIGLGLVLVWPVHSDDRTSYLAQCFLLLNGFNLLPLVPLDGGRLLDLLLFSRRATLSAGFQVVAAGGLAGLAWWFGAWIFWILAALMLLAAPARYRKARLEWVFVGNPARMPARFEDLDEHQHRELFGLAVLLTPLARTPARVAAEVRQLHEHMVARPLGRGAWIALMLLYLGGWAAGVGGLMALSTNTAREEDRLVEELVAGFDRVTSSIDTLRQEEADQEWTNLVAGWRNRSRSVQTRALNRLLTGLNQGDSIRDQRVLSLVEETGDSAGGMGAE